MISRRSIPIALAVALIAAPAVASPLEDYLHQVRQRNNEYRGWELERRAAVERERSKELVTSLSAFANARATRDEKLPTFPVFAYDRYDTRYYSAGLQGRSRFGLSTRLSYEMDYTSYKGVADPLFATIPLTFYDARPVIELTQSLWRNAGGRSTRASIQAAESEARQAAHRAEAQLRAILAEAEAAFWDLSLAREAVAVQESALESAEAIHEYTTRQSRRNLADEADSLQSGALREARRLELKIARDAERAALRRFNLLRTAAFNEPAPDLGPVDWKRIASSSAPDAGRRADVLAEEQAARLAAANAVLDADDARPLLEAFGSYALNGRDLHSNEALSDSYGAHRPTVTAGVRFSVPLELGALASTRRGALRRAAASRLRYEQAEANEKVQLADLEASLADARERLRLSQIIARAQKRKVEHERRRLRQGRASTHQVLLFEQDFSQAELNRVQAAREVMNAVARFRLYLDLAGGPS